jgi:hypothetical protein
MSEAGFETLGDVLKKAGSYHWRHSLYGEPRPPWKSDTRCVVLERDVYSEEPPPFAQAHSLRRILSVQQVQDIVENARMQLPAPTLEQLVEAFNYYFARDAFLELAPFPEE